MRKAARKPRVRPPTLNDRISALEAVVTKRSVQTPVRPDQSPLLAQLLKEATMRAATAERSYSELARKLTGLLTSDQLDAAEVSGVTPEMYAIEWIELQKKRLWPNHTATFHPLDMLKQGV